MANLNDRKKLDDTKSKGWTKWLVLIAIAIGGALLMLIGDKRTATLLNKRKREIHQNQKNIKLDMAVNSADAIANQQENISIVHKQFIDKKNAIMTQEGHDVFDNWNNGAT